MAVFSEHQIGPSGMVHFEVQKEVNSVSILRSFLDQKRGHFLTPFIPEYRKNRIRTPKCPQIGPQKTPFWVILGVILRAYIAEP